ncbi:MULTISPECIES: SDR family oxidoreductase [Halomonadaceae]|uniref:SDR family oxidoreductase n=2 Tax=Vreelandella TaxID=3137766 RepID=A0A7Z0LTI9_9GAMM|nr:MULTISPECIES: SDR family oxidoreductase [Halomonas]NYS78323.1 SDR family oxidoreductase [Halomonas glaciei]|tara:strand:+ start:985 stop:1614 length:630 start_codon:yes stop_codon:yes gene_type:complete
MTTLVIGANGQIGKQFCELAQKAGTPIKAMIRSEGQAAWFKEHGIDTVVADLEGEFEHAFDGCDQVVFTAGSGPHTGPDKTLMIDLFGAIRTADIAKQKGLSRYIMISAMRAEQPLDAPEKMRPYMAAKFAADAHLRNSRLPYVILKPGRLTDEAASQRFASSLEEAGDNQISRANVSHALLHAVQKPDLVNQEYLLLDGKRSIGEIIQ